MAVISSKLLVNTNGNDILDLTSKVKKIVRSNRVKNALVCVHVPLSTASVGVMEYDPGIVKDFFNLVNRIIPVDKIYAHNIEWEDNYAHMYMKALLTGNSVSVPFVNGEFELDRFQKILLFDFNNKPSVKSVIIQMIY